MSKTSRPGANLQSPEPESQVLQSRNDKRFTPQDADLLKTILRHRRDIRGNRFLPDPISDAELEQLLDAALYSPSVGFSQPWEFLVIRDPQTKLRVQQVFKRENESAAEQFQESKRQDYSRLKLDGITEAPVNLAVFYHPAEGPVLGQTSMPEMGLYSVVCAVQNIWLMARAMNIGVGWVSILDPDNIKRILQVPDNRRLVAYLCVGRVSEFPDSPELEALSWEKRKSRRALVYQDVFANPYFADKG